MAVLVIELYVDLVASLCIVKNDGWSLLGIWGLLMVNSMDWGFMAAWQPLSVLSKIMAGSSQNSG